MAYRGFTGTCCEPTLLTLEQAIGRGGASPWFNRHRGKTLRQRHGRFAYRTSLPADADAEKIKAQLADGVLTVRLPKPAQAGSRRIEIKG